jgi:hypothetical protein
MHSTHSLLSCTAGAAQQWAAGVGTVPVLDQNQPYFMGFYYIIIAVFYG